MSANMGSAPKVSVVMSAYNAAAYLEEAIRSILNQTFQEFEFIIINNGSTDETQSILDKYQTLDSRLRVYYHEQQGWAPAANFGCRLARGDYIAMMDADDISCPTRLERQLEYISKHPEIGIVGVWIYKIDENGSVKGTWCPPTNPKMLKWTHFFGVCTAPPSALMRREVLEKVNFYRSDVLHAEDVDFYLRASFVTEFGNVPEVLYKYRVWAGSHTQLHRQLVRDAHVRLLAAYIKDFLHIDPPLEAVWGLRQTRVGPLAENPTQIRLTVALIQKLYESFVGENNLTVGERREVSWDGAKRVASLALQAWRLDTAGFLPLFMQALNLDHRLLYPSALMRGLKRAFEQRASKAMINKPTVAGPERANLYSYMPGPCDEHGHGLSEKHIQARQD